MSRYFDQQEELAAEAEKIVGRSFQEFLEEAEGDHPLAALRFGKAYWGARKISRYDHEYNKRIDQRERFLGRKPQPLFSEKQIETLPPAAEKPAPVSDDTTATEPSALETKETDFTEENLPF